jgi:hypothetical protein
VKSNPAELWVALQGVPTFAPLWWLATSALNQTTQRYDWAIGSDPLCATLFVLSRRSPLPSGSTASLDLALARHSWRRADLVKIGLFRFQAWLLFDGSMQTKFPIDWINCPDIRER